MSRDLDNLGAGLNSSQRRSLLKRLGVSATTGVFGGAALTGGASPVAAGGDEGTSDGSNPGTDQVLDPPDGGGMTNAEWDATNEEQDEQSSVDLGTVPYPGDPPIDVCEWLPNGNELCLSAAQVIQKGVRNCANGTTPELFSATITIQEYRYENLESELTFWIGYNEQTDCIWVGQEDVGACGKVACDIDEAFDSVLDYTTAWVNKLQSIMDWIEINWNILVTVGSFLTLLAVGASILFLGTVVASILATVSTVG